MSTSYDPIDSQILERFRAVHFTKSEGRMVIRMEYRNFDHEVEMSMAFRTRAQRRNAHRFMGQMFDGSAGPVYLRNCAGNGRTITRRMDEDYAGNVVMSERGEILPVDEMERRVAETAHLEEEFLDRSSTSTNRPMAWWRFW